METSGTKAYVIKTFCTAEGKELLVPKIHDIKTLFQVDVLIESVGSGVFLSAKNPTNFYRNNFMDYFRSIVSPQHVLQLNHVVFPKKQIVDSFREIEKKHGVVIVYNSTEKTLRIQGNTEPWSAFKANITDIFGLNWEYYSQSRNSWVSLGEDVQTIFNDNFCDQDFFIIDIGDGAGIEVNVDDMEVTDDKGFIRKLRLSILSKTDSVANSQPIGDLNATYVASAGHPHSSPSQVVSGESSPAVGENPTQPLTPKPKVSVADEGESSDKPGKKPSVSPTSKPKVSVADEGESSAKPGKKPSMSPTSKPKVSVADEGESSAKPGKKPSVSPTSKPKVSVADEGESSAKPGKKPSVSPTSKPKVSVPEEGESSTEGGKKAAKSPTRRESPKLNFCRPVHPNGKPRPAGFLTQPIPSEPISWNLFAQFPSLSGAPLRSVVIEGTNVALACGGKTYFNARGLALVCEYFSSCGVEVVITLPNYRTNDVPHVPPTMDPHGDIHKLLEENRFLVIPDKMDEHLAAVEYAHLTQSVLISNNVKAKHFPPHLAAYAEGKIFTFVIIDGSITITRQMFKKFDFDREMKK